MRDLLFGNDYGWLQHELPVPLGHFAPCLAVAFGVSDAKLFMLCAAPTGGQGGFGNDPTGLSGEELGER